MYDFIDFSINKLYDFCDKDIFIAYIYWEHLRHYSEDNINYNWETFLDFVDRKLIKIKNDYEKEILEKNLEYDEKQYNKMYELKQWLEAIIENNEEWRKNLKT